MTVTLANSWVESSSSLDVPRQAILPLLGEDDAEPTSTVGGDYARTDDEDKEARAWAELSRRSLARWCKENPY